ncbi:23S rRNA (adenine(2503)-C(2))-methyltransferase RlmN [Verrucomicrobiota bacterium]
MEKLRSREAVDPHQIKLLLNALFKKAQDPAEALSVLPDKARAAFAKEVAYESLELAERHDSQIDGASKLIFRTHDGHLIESVILRPKTGRTSLCISSQVGCACSCSFCATGKMGFLRNLTAAEIADQVAITNRLVKSEERSIRNVVFMGMGEPLLNPENLFQALEILQAPSYFNYAGSRLMVSTVGIPHGMEAFTEHFPKINLALSLHSARQEIRESLMPMAKKYPLKRLRESLQKTAGHGKVMIEYLMLAGVNDGEADRLALEEYLRDIPAHINLIPFNAYPGCDLTGTPEAERRAFADQLKGEGFDCTLRYSLGTDIAAACGQLVQQKERYD